MEGKVASSSHPYLARCEPYSTDLMCTVFVIVVVVTVVDIERLVARVADDHDALPTWNDSLALIDTALAGTRWWS